MRLQETYFALDDQNLLLLELPFQLFCEIREEVTGLGRVLTNHAVDDDLIAVSHVAKFPEALVGLGKISQPFKLLQEASLTVLEPAGSIEAPSL